MIKGKLYTIVFHCIGWLVFFSVPVIFVISQSISGNSHLLSGDLFDELSLLIYIPIFYIHTYFLFPGLFFRNGKGLYFLAVGLLLIAVLLLRPFDRLTNLNRGISGEVPDRQNFSPDGADHPPRMLNNDLPPPPHSTNGRSALLPLGPPPSDGRRGQHIDIISIELFIVVIAISIALILEKRWRIAIQETSRAEADKANAELSFLKAQINPHFLFNTLNNIYSLAVTKNENVADAIMKLSNIMRYVTDDVNEDFVSLEKELDSIGDYISLQKLRLGKKAGIDFTIQGDISNKKIAPLILMPFVENAFKHGISNSAESNIVIKLTATEKFIIFYTENKLFATSRNTERTGIGSTNTKKRLAQLYPGRHLLETGSEKALFTVHLVMYI